MQDVLRTSVWNQFGASIDMLKNAIAQCPDTLWDTNDKPTEQQFWYNAFHCLFFLDYYLTLEPTDFEPPAPFSMSEFEDRMPERVYTKAELLEYLEFCYDKCQQLTQEMTLDSAQIPWINSSKTMVYPLLEILLYNMRHVQHHAAQLNLLLRQHINDAPHWVSRVDA